MDNAVFEPLAPETERPDGMKTDSQSVAFVDCGQSLPQPAAMENLFRCPVCRGPLTRNARHYTCGNQLCETWFPVVDGIPVFINDQTSLFARADFVSRRDPFKVSGRRKIVSLMDRWLPTLSRNVAAGKNYGAFAKTLMERSSQPVVLVVGGRVLGSGMEQLAANQNVRLVETDVDFGPRTQVICDACDLPFADHSFDGVVIQAVLPYVVDPDRCVREIERVLKPGGVVYAESAFIQQVVHGGHDFTRHTHLGLLRLFRCFEEIRSGPVCGPGMSLAWSAQFFLLSFARRRWTRRVIYTFSRLTLFWLKYLDGSLVKKPGAYDAASGFFFMGRKSGKVLSDRELVSCYRGAQSLILTLLDFSLDCLEII